MFDSDVLLFRQVDTLEEVREILSVSRKSIVSVLPDNGKYLITYVKTVDEIAKMREYQQQVSKTASEMVELMKNTSKSEE